VKGSYNSVTPKALLRRMTTNFFLNSESPKLLLVLQPLTASKVRRPQASLFIPVGDILISSDRCHFLTLQMTHTPTVHTRIPRPSSVSRPASMIVRSRGQCLLGQCIPLETPTALPTGEVQLWSAKPRLRPWILASTRNTLSVFRHLPTYCDSRSPVDPQVAPCSQAMMSQQGFPRKIPLVSQVSALVR